jgi:Protein of unknown function (DUF4242)
MKKITKQLAICLLSALLLSITAMAQTTQTSDNSKNTKEMHTYVIERNIPGAGEFSAAKLKTISQTSCSVLKEMGPGIQWLQSYVTDNKIFCVYKAENIEMLKEHAQKGGFPINAVYEVENIISPATAN